MNHYDPYIGDRELDPPEDEFCCTYCGSSAKCEDCIREDRDDAELNEEFYND